jgi:hypothetical protein
MPSNAIVATRVTIRPNPSSLDLNLDGANQNGKNKKGTIGDYVFGKDALRRCSPKNVLPQVLDHAPRGKRRWYNSLPIGVAQ